eukprot:gene593-639_t
MHMWSQALCNALQRGETLQQLPDQVWVWNERKFCTGREHQPLRCYFNITNHCPPHHGRPIIIDYRNDLSNCPNWIPDEKARQPFRAAAMELLFSHLSNDLIQEVELAGRAIFGEKGIPHENLLTVHIRWGDKASEMRLVDIPTYIQALSTFINQASISDPHIFITTESSNARKKLEQAIHDKGLNWKLFHYEPPEVAQPDLERIPIHVAFASEGASGKASMIALLLSLEARYFVLTSGSNWSRLINELRTNVVDAQCGNCTRMVDLQQAFKFHNWRI